MMRAFQTQSVQCRPNLLPIPGRTGRTETGASGVTAWSGPNTPSTLLDLRAGFASPAFFVGAVK